MNCRLCKKKFTGRSDKIFCSVNCKSIYHRKLHESTIQASRMIDQILHRNRSILLEILGNTMRYKKVSKDLLDKKKFNYSYVTAYHLNTQNKMINYVYDFSWAVFSDNEIAITRLKK